MSKTHRTWNTPYSYYLAIVTAQRPGFLLNWKTEMPETEPGTQCVRRVAYNTEFMYWSVKYFICKLMQLQTLIRQKRNRFDRLGIFYNKEEWTVPHLFKCDIPGADQKNTRPLRFQVSCNSSLRERPFLTCLGQWVPDQCHRFVIDVSRWECRLWWAR